MVGNSWVKASKKLTVENELYKAKKSLFHSFRIMMFGIQIAKFGKIVDYKEANGIWDEIKGIEATNWLHYYDKYKKMWNATKSAFKVVAPK
jgi:hypothetical protein